MAHYYSMPGGGVAFREQEGAVPEGWVEIQESEYAIRLEEIKAADEAILAPIREAKEAAKASAIDKLSALGLTLEEIAALRI